MSQADADEIEVFDEIHTKEGPPLFDGNTVYFPDGAKREDSIPSLMRKPSDDPNERNRTIVFYWECLLDQRQRAFDKLKAKIARLEGRVAERDVEQLKQLRLDVMNAANGLEDAEKLTVEENPQIARWSHEVTERYRRLGKNQRAAMEFMNSHDIQNLTEKESDEFYFLQGEINLYTRDTRFALDKLRAIGASLTPDQQAIQAELDGDREEQRRLREEAQKLEV